MSGRVQGRAAKAVLEGNARTSKDDVEKFELEGSDTEPDSKLNRLLVSSWHFMPSYPLYVYAETVVRKCKDHLDIEVNAQTVGLSTG